MVNMNIATVFSLIAFSALAVFSVTLIIWWLKREKTTMIRFPILSVIKQKPRRLTAIIWQKPPLLSFIFFALAGMATVFLAFRPSEEIPSASDQKQRAHIFLDLSPSMAAFISEEKLHKDMLGLGEKLAKNYILSISTSAQQNPGSERGEEALMPALNNLHFHRPGLRLVNAITEHLSQLDDIDHLFIVSDGDAYSWQGFNWKVLAERLKLHFIDVSGSSDKRKNIYIEDISRGLRQGQSEDFMVRIARNVPSTLAEATLKVSRAEKTLFETNFTFPDDLKTMTIDARLPAIEVSDGNVSDNEIVWEISTPSDQDSLALDNTFVTSAHGPRERIVISGGLAGEQELAEPSYYLRKTLELFNFDIALFESPLSFNESAYKDRLSILLYEDAYSYKDVCNIAPPGETEVILPSLWIAPAQKYTNYGELCRCSLNIYLRQKPDATGKSELCRDVKSREDFNTLLRSIGALPLGGKVSDTSQSLAWILPDTKITVFSLPLNPDPMLGLTHGVFPVMIKELLIAQKLLSAERERKLSTSWPRVADITKMFKAQTEDQKQDNWIHIMEKSNIPREESQLMAQSRSELPPRSRFPEEMFSSQDIEAMNTEKSYTRILKFVVLFLMFILFIDAVVNFLNKKNERIPIQNILFILAFATLYSPKSQAQVTLNIIEKGFIKDEFVFRNLKKEIEDRTSLIMLSKAQVSGSINKSEFEQPWLWLMDAHRLNELKKDDEVNLLLWLRRGGFLIVENSEAKLGELSRIFRNIPESTNPQEWKIISPDHELMRSFYLLDALNSCDPGIWQGFHFDKRLAVLAIPGHFLSLLSDGSGMKISRCATNINEEKLTRTFVNILMVALATDYKKDQIHLPEILKRLRR